MGTTGIRRDCHTHTTYSDGWDAREMADAAAACGLDGIGFSDHCILWEDPFDRHTRFDFDETYAERRRELHAVGDEVGIDVHDGVEVNYDPNHEEAIRAFLDEANFEYVIGSVHYAGGHHVAHPDACDDASAEAKRATVEAYVDWQVRLIESGLFDVLGHLDLTQRAPALRGVMRREEYRRLAEALAASRTVPEINAGRLDRAYGEVHPHPDALDVFREYEVPFVIGTDAHAPDQLRSRIGLLETSLDELGIDVIDPPGMGT